MENGELEKLKIDRNVKNASGIRWRFPSRLLFFSVLILVGGLGATGWFSRGFEVDAGTAKFIHPSQAYALLSATGYVIPQTKAAVSSKGTGRLEKLFVQEGGRVKKGEVIAKLEDEDVLAEKQKAAANVHLAEAELIEAQAGLEESDLRLQRAQRLIKTNFISQQEFEAEVASNSRARAAVKSALARIAAAKAELEAARVAEEYTRIRAPFDGIILTKNADIGDVVAPFSSSIDSKAAVVSMADLDTLEVEANVSESNLLKAMVGQPCVVELDALPDRMLRCRVSRIVPTVDRSKATVLVKVGFVDKDQRVLPNMSAKVTFLSKPLSPEDSRPILVVPTAAVVNGSKPYVFVLRQNRVKRVPVETGIAIENFIQIEAGLKSGDEVVLNPPANLTESARVRRRSS